MEEIKNVDVDIANDIDENRVLSEEDQKETTFETVNGSEVEKLDKE